MIKEIKGKFEADYPAEQQIRKYKRHGSEFIENQKFMYAHEWIIIPVTMHVRVSTPKTIEFKSKLGFNQYDIILTKKQSVLKSVMDAFEGENMQTQYSVLDYRIDLYFYDYKLAIEVDKRGDKDRNIDHEIQRQKALEKELSGKFIRIDPDEEDFNIFKAINEIHRHINKSTKTLTEKSIRNEAKKLLNQHLNLVIMAQYLSLQKTLLDTSCLQYKE